MGMDFKQNTQAAVVCCPCLVLLSSSWTQSDLLLSSLSNFLALSHCFSGIWYPLLTANSVCLNELWDPMLYTTHMTMQQNGKEGDEKIIAIHSILPGDVISITVKGGGEERDDKEMSVSMRDKHWATVGRKKMRQMGRCRKAGDLKCIPFISSPQASSRDASWRSNLVISFSSHCNYMC